MTTRKHKPKKQLKLKPPTKQIRSAIRAGSNLIVTGVALGVLGKLLKK